MWVRNWVCTASAMCALCLVAPAQGASDHRSGDGTSADNERLLPGQYPASPMALDAPGEDETPFFDLDWSLGLRGSFTRGSNGERFDVRLVPHVELDHQGRRASINITGDADLVRADQDNPELTGLRLGLRGAYALDSLTAVTTNANVELNQPLAGALGAAPGVAREAQHLSGGLELGVRREFGRFNVTLTGGAERHSYGPSTRRDGTTQDNRERDYWALDSALRVGFQATPIFEVFGQAGLGRDVFDHPSSVLLVTPDATDLSLRGGVTGRWNTTLEATASTGIALRKFDAAGLEEVVSQLYDASVTFTPDADWRLRAGLGTTLSPAGPDARGTTQLRYAATAEVNYLVNSWLALRADADWYRTVQIGSAETGSGYGWGMGADYRLNAHTALNADYGYDRAETSTSGVEDAHRVSVGVTLSR
ncbi:MAG TPA: outer membrane beta-barrel protein [Devosia sp.]|nr:outer membrane beta-barrel protein [Devosia sp.]